MNLQKDFIPLYDRKLIFSKSCSKDAISMSFHSNELKSSPDRDKQYQSRTTYQSLIDRYL